MSASDNEGYYRSLLEAAQNGVENGKAFLEAIRTSDAAAHDANIQEMVESMTRQISHLENEADQLWDLFKRIQKRGYSSETRKL